MYSKCFVLTWRDESERNNPQYEHVFNLKDGVEFNEESASYIHLEATESPIFSVWSKGEKINVPGVIYSYMYIYYIYIYLHIYINMHNNRMRYVCGSYI